MIRTGRRTLDSASLDVRRARGGGMKRQDARDAKRVEGGSTETGRRLRWAAGRMPAWVRRGGTSCSRPQKITPDIFCRSFFPLLAVPGALALHSPAPGPPHIKRC